MQPRNYLRALLSVTLAAAVTTVFSLRSFAAAEAPAAPEPAFAQDCNGTLTVKGGTVTINGNAAQTGATVMNGSVVSTTSGHAIIELGALGRVELSNHTTATIICTGNTLVVRSNCGGKTDVEVKRGQVTVGSETLAAGKSKEYRGQVEINAATGTEIEVECEGDHGAALMTGPGLIGLLALIGVGAGIAAGIALGEGDTDAAGRQVSPTVP